MARQQLIQFRRGTASAWTSANPILASGEEGFETDTYKFKIGDGTTAWTSLPYAKIDESNLLHLSGTETVTGAKTFPASTKIAGTTNTWGYSASGAALENLGSNDTFYKTQNNMYFQPNNGGITKVSIVGGKLILDGGDPTTALGASTKQYTDAAATKVRYAFAYVGLTTGDYPVSSYSNVHSAINAAISAVNSAGGGIVKLGAGVFNITGQIVPASNVRLVGESMTATTLLGGVGSGYTIAKTGTGGVDNFTIEDLTIDTNNVTNAAGIRLEYATSCSIKNVEIKNTKSWQIVLSTTDGTDTNYRNSDILIQDVRLSGKDSTLGSILFNNSQRIKINRTKITTISGPSIELYQVLNDIDITKSTITNTAGVGAYYSLSTNNIRFSDCSFIGGSLSGANRSDNGAFGATQAYNVSVDNCYFRGNSSGVQIGAVDNMKVTNSTFDGCADLGIIVDDGNAPVSAMPTNWIIDNCTIKNSNTNNTSHSIHPGILLKEIGGAQYGKITNNLFYDSQATKTQRFPISFNGNFTYNNIEILNNRLSADTANGGKSIVLTDSAVLGANVLIQGNTDYSGTNPAQSVAAQADATTTSKGAVQLAGELGGPNSSASAPTIKNIQRVYNIRDYGAVGGFTTNDASAIQAAINAAATAGGGTVEIPLDTFGISTTIVLKSKVNLRGQGKGSVIKLLNGANTHMFRNENWTAGTIADSDIIIEKVTFDGNGPNQTASGDSNDNNRQNGIILKSIRNVTIQNCTFSEINGFNINADRVNGSDGLTSYPRNINMINNVFNKTSACLYYWDMVAVGVIGGSFVGNKMFTDLATNNNFTSPLLKDFVFDRNVCEAPLRAYSIETVSGLTSTNLVVSNNTMSTSSNIIYLGGAGNCSDVKLTNNTITNTSGYTLTLTSTCFNVKFDNNTVVSGQYWFNLNSGVYDFKARGNTMSMISGASDGIILRGNTDVDIHHNKLDGTNANRPITFTGNSTSVRIYGNKITAPNHSCVYLSGTSTDVLTKIVIQQNEFNTSKYGSVYGSATIADSLISNNEFDTWETDGGATYAAIRGKFTNSVIALNRLKNTGTSRGIVEDSGASLNRIVGNVIDGVATTIVYDAASGSSVLGAVSLSGLTGLGVGTSSPQSTAHISGTNGEQLIVSTTSNSAGGVAGLEFRYNNGIANTRLAAIETTTQSGGGANLDIKTAATGGSVYTTKASFLKGGGLDNKGYLINNLAAGVDANDAVNYSQIQTLDGGTF